MSQRFTLSIVIPAYNEEATILSLLDKVCATDLIEETKKEIIVVDDGSSDQTASVVNDFIRTQKEKEGVSSIRLISHPHNGGKGTAVRSGIKATKGDFIIIQDADLEYDPEDYNPILESLIHGQHSVVYGSRFLLKKNRHSYLSFYWGGRLVSFVTNLLYRQHLTDEPTCYKAFSSALLKSIPLHCKRFEFCPEVTAKVAKKGIKIKEVPIHYYPRSIEEGKKIKWTDGLQAIWVLLKYRFKK